MKWIFSLLILFSTESYAQNAITETQVKTYSDFLVQKGFLTAKGQQMLIDEIKKAHIEVDQPSTVKSISYSRMHLSKETILLFCSAAIITERAHRLFNNGMDIEEKISPKEPPGDSSGRTFTLIDHLGGKRDYDSCIAAQTSIIGYTRTKTLQTFFQSGLIDEKIYNECAAALRTLRLRDEVDLLQYMLKRSTYYTYFEFNRAEQESYIDYLVAMGILTEEEKKDLLGSYKNFELKTIPEMLQHSKRYTQVDLHSYAPDPRVIYPVIFEAFRKLFPSFNYSNLDVEIVKKKERDLIREDVRLSFNIDTNRYVHTFYHDYKRQKRKRGETEDEASRVDEDFHKGINKWLTDIESPFRLYTVNIQDTVMDAYTNESIGLLLLKHGEDSMITTDVNLLSRETFNAGMSSMNVQKMIDAFTQQKFFVHLTDAQIFAARQKIAETDVSSLEDILLQFPKTIVLFDWETGNLKNPYEELTREFMQASRGAFKVTHIIDEFKKGNKAKKIRYGFTLNGKKYEQLLECENDWLDPDFFALLNTALEENKVDGKFYYCIDNGQESGYIFLTTAQHQFIKQSYPHLLKEQ